MTSVPPSKNPTTFFPKPFRVDVNQLGYSRSPSVLSSSRKSSVRPFRHQSAAASLGSGEPTEDDLLFLSQRHAATVRLQEAWDSVTQKYTTNYTDDDDEIDLRTGKIVKDRGRLRKLEKRDFGEGLENQDELFPTFKSLDIIPPPIFDEDEDPLGVWDERSGLDDQYETEEEEPEEKPEPVRSKEDDEDLRNFLRANQQLYANLEEDESDDDEMSDGVEEEEQSLNKMRSIRRATSIVDDLETLFPRSDGIESDSEDELAKEDSGHEVVEVMAIEQSEVGDLALTDSEKEAGLEQEQLFTAQGKVIIGVPASRQGRMTLEVVLPSRLISPREYTPLRMTIPPRPYRSVPSSSISTISEPTLSSPPSSPSSPQSTSVPTGRPSLRDLFTPEPEDNLQRTKSAPQPRPLKSSLHCSSSFLTARKQYSAETPTLESLFITPPKGMRAGPSRRSGASGPPSRVRFADIEPSRSPEPPASSPTQSRSNAKFKGKSRMVGERPTADPPKPAQTALTTPPHTIQTNDSPYLPTLRYHWNGTGVPFTCKLCVRAGGERKEKAEFCKGRNKWYLCQLEEQVITLSAEKKGQTDGGTKLSSPRSVDRRKGWRKWSVVSDRIGDKARKKGSPLPPSSPVFDQSSEWNILDSDSHLSTHSSQPRRRTRGEDTSRRKTSAPIVPTCSSPPPTNRGSSSDQRSGAIDHSSDPMISSPSAGEVDSSPPLRRSTRRPTMRNGLHTPNSASMSPVRAMAVTTSSVAKLPVREMSISSSSARHTARPFLSKSLSSDHTPLTIPRPTRPNTTLIKRPSLPTLESARRQTPFNHDWRHRQRSQTVITSRSPEEAESEDELLLKDEDFDVLDTSPPSSPAVGRGHLDTRYMREMEVRAKDVGLTLGHHSGRLPAKLLDALTGSMGSMIVPTQTSTIIDRTSLPPPPRSSGSTGTFGNTMSPPGSSPRPTAIGPTLGNSIHQNESHYVLPTPPPSFGSGRSKSGRPIFVTTHSHRSASDAPSSGGGLMLPPPLPQRTSSDFSRQGERLTMSSPAKRPCPTEEEDAEGDSDNFPRPRPLSAQNHNHHNNQNRLRSNSLSLVSNRQTITSSKSLPNVRRSRTSMMPAKNRNRTERDLARLAKGEVFEDAGLEWGMDEDVGFEIARLFREGSVVQYL